MFSKKETIFIAAVLGAAFIFIATSEVKENRIWAKFKQQHNCKIVAKEKGQSNIGAVGTSTAVILSQDKVAYKCDDGITYWR